MWTHRGTCAWTVMGQCQNPSSRHFPGAAVVRIPHLQCRGQGFDPWSGN